MIIYLKYVMNKVECVAVVAKIAPEVVRLIR